MLEFVGGRVPHFPMGVKTSTRFAEAEDHFQRSLELAHRQGALAWELRTAMSLARLWEQQRKTSQARA
jgi:predicted ATPase